MENIFFITALLLGNQFAFGMSHLVLNTLAEGLGIERDEVIKLLQINESEIRTINYEESGDYKGYCATLNNGDKICADFFVAGPHQGSFFCVRSTCDKRGSLYQILLNNDTYDQLRNLHEAQNH